MESVLGRYRNLIILVGVLFLQFLGLAVQVKRTHEAENTRLIRVLAVDAVTPLERVLVWAQTGSGNLWHNYFYLRGVRAENRQLREQIEHMRLAQVRLSEDATQAHRLQSLLAFKEQFISKTVAAQVIGSSGSDQSRILYIDKGSDDGIKQDMAVITADGIVGKVWEVSTPSTSKVLLINDQSSGVGAILEKSRLQGVIRGTAGGEVALERVMSDEQVSPGDTVLSSGGDQIFPKGLPVGTVTKVGTGKDLFLKITVKPAANLSQLEEVLVVVQKQEQAPVAQDTGRMRAVDILAERLPSVPDKAPDTKAVPTTGGEIAATAATAVPSTSGNDTVKKAPVVAPASGAVGSHTVPAAGQNASAGTQKILPPKPEASKPTSGIPPAAKASGATNPSTSGTSGAGQTTKPVPKPVTAPLKPATAQSGAPHNAQSPAPPPATDGSPQ